MRTSSRLVMAALGLAALAWPATVSSQTRSTSKACGLLPTKELEAHFGSPAGAVRGSDTSTVSSCSADFPDRKRGLDLSIRPPGPASMSVEQRFAAMRRLLETNKSRTQTFGNVGCFTDRTELAGATLPVTTCFVDQKGYVSLSIRSDNPKHLDFEAVKQLLEKAAARRN